MGGICNCCLDHQNMAYLLENDCIEFTVKCLSRCCASVAISATFLYIDVYCTAQMKRLFFQL